MPRQVRSIAKVRPTGPAPAIRTGNVLIARELSTQPRPGLFPHRPPVDRGLARAEATRSIAYGNCGASSGTPARPGSRVMLMATTITALVATKNQPSAP